MGLDNPLHIAFLVVILLLLFGAKRLPEIGRSLGSGMREFKDSVTGSGSHPQQPALSQTSQTPAPPAQAPPPAAQAPVQSAPPAPQAPAQPAVQPVEPAPAPVEPTHQA